MRTKLDALFVRDQASLWLKNRESAINPKYEEAINKAMQSSLSNMWLGRTRDKAIKFLDFWKSGPFFNSFKEDLEFKGGYWTNIVKDAHKMANLSLAKGNSEVWLTEDELFFIKDLE